MKSFFRKTIVVVMCMVVAGVLSACSQDESVAVKSYNNSIVQIQKDMLNKAQDSSKVFGQSDVDIQKITTTLQQIKSDIDSSHYAFKALSIPRGAEDLADAMENFFQVETQGMSDVIAAVQQIQGKANDPNAVKTFTDTFTQFGTRENQALKDFYTTQQRVADQYGQKVVQTDQTSQ